MAGRRKFFNSDTTVLAAAVLVAAGLRFATLAHQSLDEDETVSLWLMHHSLGGLWRDIPRTESTPPLFYVAEWAWTRIFGTGAAGLRSLSAVVGVATVPVCWAAAREAGGRRAGTVAAVLAALSPAALWYSQEARSYALLMLFSAASLLFLQRVLGGGGRRSLVGWTLCAALAVASHYFAVFVVAPEAAWLLATGAPTRSRRERLVAVVALAAVGLALLPLALTQSRNGGSSWIGDIPLWGRLTDVPPQLMLGDGRPLLSWSFATVLAIPLLAPAAYVLLFGRRRERSAVALPVAIGLIAVALPVAIDLAGRHILLDRNLLGAGAVLLIACAIAMGSRRLGRVGLVAAAVVACLFAADLAMAFTNPRMQREPWAAAARGLGQATVPRAIVFGPNVSNPPPAPELVTFQAAYLPSMLTMPDRGWNVREIDELDVRDDLSDTDPRPQPVSPGRGWRLVARAGTQTWTLYRFQTARPRHVTPDQLFAENLLANREQGDELIGLQLPARG